ncbi:MAG: hypothetical protein ABIY70_21865 [Capsulimonas sp.]|uniref:hypothetical protein n=1 Tax=Capsulimonas sp. TaxID=2494211 RepID=UPI00326519B5
MTSILKTIFTATVAVGVCATGTAMAAAASYQVKPIHAAPTPMAASQNISRVMSKSSDKCRVRRQKLSEFTLLPHPALNADRHLDLTPFMLLPVRSDKQ